MVEALRPTARPSLVALALLALAVIGVALLAGRRDGDDTADRSAPATAPSADGPVPGPATARVPRGPLVAVVSRLSGSAPVLTRLDRRSLERRGPRLPLGEYHDAWSFSPDGKRLALGMGGPGQKTCGAGVCIVDLQSMKVSADVETPIAAEAVAWLTPRRLVAILQSGEVVVADPSDGRIVRRQPLSIGPLLAPAVALWGDRLVALVTAPEGAARLVVVNARGSVRAADLPGIDLASEPHLPPQRPALAVDRMRARALVIAGQAPAAEVDLTTMAVRRHPPPAPPSAAVPGGRRSSSRHAVWLDRDLLAVSGEDALGPPGRVRRFPAGVHLLETREWTARPLEPRASRVRIAAGRLVAYTQPPAASGAGLRVYTRRADRLLRRRFGGEALDVQVAGAFAYVLARRVLYVVRADSGQVVGRHARTRGSGVELLVTAMGTGGHYMG